MKAELTQSDAIIIIWTRKSYDINVREKAVNKVVAAIEVLMIDVVAGVLCLKEDFIDGLCNLGNYFGQAGRDCI